MEFRALVSIYRSSSALLSPSHPKRTLLAPSILPSLLPPHHLLGALEIRTILYLLATLIRAQRPDISASGAPHQAGFICPLIIDFFGFPSKQSGQLTITLRSFPDIQLHHIYHLRLLAIAVCNDQSCEHGGRRSSRGVQDERPRQWLSQRLCR